MKAPRRGTGRPRPGVDERNRGQASAAVAARPVQACGRVGAHRFGYELSEFHRLTTSAITSADLLVEGWSIGRLLSLPRVAILRHRLTQLCVFRLPGNQPVLGAGEVVITNVPAAIGNALFDATGKRLREVPFTAARVRAALAAESR